MLLVSTNPQSTCNCMTPLRTPLDTDVVVWQYRATRGSYLRKVLLEKCVDDILPLRSRLQLRTSTYEITEMMEKAQAKLEQMLPLLREKGESIRNVKQLEIPHLKYAETPAWMSPRPSAVVTLSLSSVHSEAQQLSSDSAEALDSDE